MRIIDEENSNKEVISSEIKNLLVNQLQHEMKNHNLYKMFALFYNSKGLFKMEDYYTKRAVEELKHYNWIQEYLLDCDVKIISDLEIPANDNDIPDLNQPIIDTVEREIETTQLICKIANQAVKELDWKTFNFLNKNLIPEQVEEEKLSRNILKITSIDTDWLSKEDSVSDYYGK